MTEPTQTPPPTPPTPPAPRKNPLSQREKRRRRLLGDRRAANQAKAVARAKKGKPDPKPKIAYELDKATGRFEHKRIDKPVKPSTQE